MASGKVKSSAIGIGRALTLRPFARTLPPMLRAPWGIFCLWLASAAGGFATPLYYPLSDLNSAVKEAQALHRPIAWLGTYPQCLSEAPKDATSATALTQMALQALKDEAIVIVFDGQKISEIPDYIHAEFHKHDDGELPNNDAWIVPKIAFTASDGTTVLSRVCYTEMKSGREAPILSALQVIRSQARVEVPVKPTEPKPPVVVLEPAPASGGGSSAVPELAQGLVIWG